MVQLRWIGGSGLVASSTTGVFGSAGGSKRGNSTLIVYVPIRTPSGLNCGAVALDSHGCNPWNAWHQFGESRNATAFSPWVARQIYINAAMDWANDSRTMPLLQSWEWIGSRSLGFRWLRELTLGYQMPSHSRLNRTESTEVGIVASGHLSCLEFRIE